MLIPRALLWGAIEEDDKGDQLEAAYNCVIKRLSLDASQLNEEWVKNTRTKLASILYTFKEKLKKVGRHKGRFLEKYNDWLKTTEEFSPPVVKTSKPASTDRRKKEFADLSDRSKRARTEDLRAGTSAEEISFAAQMKLRESGQSEAAAIVKKTIESSPRTLQIFYDFLKAKEKGKESKGTRPYSVEEALAHQYQCRLTKGQYTYNRLSLIDHNAKLFPSYDRLVEYRKKYCYPSGIEITETKASVPIQNLLDHTVVRIAESVEEVLKHVQAEALTKTKLICKIGFDSSSHHSTYNQQWQDKEANDNSLLLTSIVPLLLHCKDESTGKETILWLNHRPSSTACCRPLELEFTKETTGKIKQHLKSLEESIKNLNDSSTEVSGIKVTCTHELLMTMLDGKVSSAATSTANQTCNVCKATPSMMNNIEKLEARECDANAYNYGLSVLHAHIRFLEYMLNVAYRLDIKKSYTQYSAAEKKTMDEKRKYILQKIKNEIGLNLDQPGKSGGNTNTGNNARRFFENYVRVSAITGLDLDVLKRIRTVLRSLSCGFSVDPDKFHIFAIETATKLTSLYSWYYMPSSVHTVLVHGSAFMRHFPVPLGMLSEEALESRHKDLRYLRLHHARKASRVFNMHDMFHGLMARSDIIVSFLRKPPQPKGCLDREVLDMLLTPSDGELQSGPLEPILEEEEDSEDEDDWEL